MKTKAISAIIASLLLILLSVAAVAILWSFINPMIRGNLETGKSCFELREYFTVSDSEYTYYNSTKTSIMIERSSEEYNVSGFIASLEHDSQSTRFDIINGRVTGVKMLVSSGDTEDLKIPKSGEARTYIFDIGNATKVNIAPIRLDGGLCDAISYPIQKK